LLDRFDVALRELAVGCRPATPGHNAWTVRVAEIQQVPQLVRGGVVQPNAAVRAAPAIRGVGPLLRSRSEFVAPLPARRNGDMALPTRPQVRGAARAKHNTLRLPAHELLEHEVVGTLLEELPRNVGKHVRCALLSAALRDLLVDGAPIPCEVAGAPTFMLTTHKVRVSTPHRRLREERADNIPLDTGVFIHLVHSQENLQDVPLCQVCGQRSPRVAHIPIGIQRHCSS